MLSIPLVILRGLPGSGKSTLTSEISFYNKIDPDTLYVLYEATTDLCNYKYRINFLQAVSSLKKCIPVIWMQCWSTCDGIRFTFNAIKEACSGVSIRPVVIELELDFNTAYHRHKRSKLPLNNIISYQTYIDNYVQAFEEFNLLGILHILLKNDNKRNCKEKMTQILYSLLSDSTNPSNTSGETRGPILVVKKPGNSSK